MFSSVPQNGFVAGPRAHIDVTPEPWLIEAAKAIHRGGFPRRRHPCAVLNVELIATTTTVVRAAPALGPAAVLWLAATKASAPAYASGWQSAVVEALMSLAATKASAPAYASGWQSAVVEALMSWAAGSARKPWR